MFIKESFCSNLEENGEKTASGAMLGDVWTDASMLVVDSLGDVFLQTVQTGMMVSIGEDGVVTLEDAAE